MSRFAVRLDAGDVVREVFVAAGAPRLADAERPFLQLLDPSSATLGRELLSQARRTGVALGHELLVRTSDVPRLLLGAALSLGDDVLVLAAPTGAALQALGAELDGHVPEAARERLVRALRELSPELGGAAVTELMRLNNQLATLERELAARNAELERLAGQKDRMLSTVAHDLRSPLNGIALAVAYLEADKESLPDEKHERVLARIGGSVRLMTRLIDDLIDVSSLANGAPRLQVGRTELLPVFAEALELHGRLARERGVRIEAELPSTLPTVEADPDRLHQVLGNLLSNAVDHSPEGGLVRLASEQQGELVVVRVIDQGPGVKPEEAATIFEPFARGTGARRHEGCLGLGLAISKVLVEAHGGEIGQRNLPAGGAEFRFSLPVSERAERVAEGAG